MVVMRLADDDRGRVPFALVGVLLLLGSTTYATALAGHGAAPVDRDVDVALERTATASETALQRAVVRAARDAVRTPVVTPADTRWGDVVNGSTPFRDALRIRIYVETRRALRAASHGSGDVTATVGLPATPNASALRAAKRRVTVTGVENDSALRVTLDGVRLTARRDGRVVARETATLTRTVPTPVLALHDRTERFQTRLRAGPLQGPGLGRRLTARLYAVAWARGYGQHGGAPINNVLANRHVALSTNAAVLELQRDAFGRPDPTVAEALARDTLRTTGRDTAAALGTRETAFVGALDTEDRLPDPDDAPRRVPRIAPDDAPGPERPLTVGVNHTADRAFAAVLNGDGRRLDEVLRRSYRATLRLRTAKRLVEREPQPVVVTPGRGWTLATESVESTTDVHSDDEPVDGPRPPTSEGWHRFETHARHVTVEHTVEWTWERGNQTTETSATWTEQFVVALAVDGRHAPPGLAPERPVEPVFERGGALDGPNLADVPEESSWLLDANGGVERLAERTARGTLDASTVNATVDDADRPDDLFRWTYDDVTTLRAEIRAISVTVPAGEAASGTANPASTLAERVRERRAELVEAPERYDGVADRARVAARAAYVDEVVDRLERRANRTGRVNDGILERLDGTVLGSDERVRTVLRNHSVRPPRDGTLHGPLGGPDVLVPQGGPAYLDASGSPGSRVPDVAEGETYYGLTARNLNVYTVPYGDAAEAAVGAASGPERVRLRTAARTLAAVDRAIERGNGTPTLRERREHLRRGVERSLGFVAGRTRSVLGERTALVPSQRRRVVRTAMTGWNGTATRALAVTNGSFGERVVEATERFDVENRTRDRLRVELRVALVEARGEEAATVDRAPVEGATATLREVATVAAKEAAKGAVKNATERVQRRRGVEPVGLFAGLPVLPAPGYWYATVNLWEVQVHGRYQRFAVRTRQGSPGETLTYVRDGGVATLDVDGDGEAEALGTADRIAFDVSTVVVVAVPPGLRGVGDTNGVANETSPGWETTACPPACRTE